MPGKLFFCLIFCLICLISNRNECDIQSLHAQEKLKIRKFMGEDDFLCNPASSTPLSVKSWFYSQLELKKDACCILWPYLHRKGCTRRIKCTKITFANEFSGFQPCLIQEEIDKRTTSQVVLKNPARCTHWFFCNSALKYKANLIAVLDLFILKGHNSGSDCDIKYKFSYFSPEYWLFPSTPGL